MSAITTHVLDLARGAPATGVPVALAFDDPTTGWRTIGHGATDNDGRLKTLLPDGISPAPGRYRLTFNTGAYFSALAVSAFYPEITVVFDIRDGTQHYHVPLLLSPYGYSTYRGS